MSSDAKQCGPTLRGNWLTADEQQCHQWVPPSWHLHVILLLRLNRSPIKAIVQSVYILFVNGRGFFETVFSKSSQTIQTQIVKYNERLPGKRPSKPVTSDNNIITSRKNKTELWGKMQIGPTGASARTITNKGMFYFRLPLSELMQCMPPLPTVKGKRHRVLWSSVRPSVR